MEFEHYIVRRSRLEDDDYPLEVVSVVTKMSHFLPNSPPKWQTFENRVALCKTPEEANDVLMKVTGVFKT